MTKSTAFDKRADIYILSWSSIWQLKNQIINR